VNSNSGDVRNATNTSGTRLVKWLSSEHDATSNTIWITDHRGPEKTRSLTRIRTIFMVMVIVRYQQKRTMPTVFWRGIETMRRAPDESACGRPRSALSLRTTSHEIERAGETSITDGTGRTNCWWLDFGNSNDKHCGYRYRLDRCTARRTIMTILLLL